MKQYQLILNVPDDFDPETLNLSLTDPKYEEGINIYDEGFVGDEDTASLDVESISSRIIAEQLPEVTKSSVVLFKYPVELMNPEIIMPIQKMIESKLGCTTMGIVNSIDVLIQNSVEATKMLEGMINKINANAIIKLS